MPDTSPGGAGNHAPAKEFVLTIRNREYPITKGLPDFWPHTKDECYSRLRATEWASADKVSQKIPATFPHII